jgi:hypothetical protein
MMTHIMKIAAVKNATAIWEYNPDLPDNHMLGGSLDIIAVICTIAIKVRLSQKNARRISNLLFD